MITDLAITFGIGGLLLASIIGAAACGISIIFNRG